MSSNSPSIESTSGIPAAPNSETSALCAEMSEMPLPQKEHEWLRQFVGDWDSEIEMLGAPGQPAMQSKGTDRVRMIGGFWLVSEGRNDEFPYVCQLALGYDPETQKYVGTWIDSMSSYLWHYEGQVDGTGRILTLEAEGPFPPVPGAPLSKFREVTEFKSPDHRAFTSSRLAEDGTWTLCLRINFRRKPDENQSPDDPRL